jgi:hypothetical protein
MHDRIRFIQAGAGSSGALGLTMRDCPPPWHKSNLGAQIPWSRLSVVWNDGSLAYKITRYSEFRNIPSWPFVSVSGAYEFTSVELLRSEYSGLPI